MTPKRFFLFVSVFALFFVSGVQANEREMGKLQRELTHSYGKWRTAMVNKDAKAWAMATAEHRKLAIKNRINSEQRAFPHSVFSLPVAPPSLKNLKALRAHQKGLTATGVYFGKVDFGMGGVPTDNLLLLHFILERTGWKYDTADFISLAALPDIRAQLKAGDYSYVDQKDFLPSGRVPQMPFAVGRAEYIAKVYVFCPGREVRVKVNKISDHRFQDTKAAEVVIGGALTGLNEVQFSTKSLEGSTGKEALSVRVYLMSTTAGVKPLKVYEYQVAEGGAVKPFGGGNFTVTHAEKKKKKKKKKLKM